MDYITNSKFNINDTNENLQIKFNDINLPSENWVNRARKLRSRRWKVVNRKTMNDVFTRR